ncbi:MAG: zinc ribbon domain-containing protein [Candidatus Altiarchaeota archaeon]
MICESCGMPMEAPGDYGGGKVGGKYCVHCTDAKGNLLPRDKVRENLIKFLMSPAGEDNYGEKVEKREDAEKIIDDVMSEMPAWIGKPAE